MSSDLISYVLSLRGFRGDFRLVHLSAADNGGRTNPSTASAWLGVSNETAAIVLNHMLSLGYVSVSGDGWYVFPDLVRAREDHTFSGRIASRRKKVKISRHLRDRVFEKHGRKCHYCGASDMLTMDHIVPEKSGGDTREENLIPACHSCNSSKGAKSYDEFIQWISKKKGEKEEGDALV